MAIKLDLVGKKSDPTPFSYSWKDAVLYALGVGAKVDELDFLYEGRGPKVLPTFAVVPSFTALISVAGDLGANPMMILHGEQKVVLHRPIPPNGKLMTTSEVKGIYDKGKGALVVVEAKTVDERGQPVFDNQFSIFVRGEGGFGGDRGPEAVKADPPAGKAPDFEVVEQTTKEQALLYRLSGDVNPLHADPNMAKLGGFDRPILHGLCTFGHAGRAVVRGACGGDPNKLKSFGARFSGVVFPGDTLTTRGWKVDGGYVVTTSTQEGRVVLSNAIAELGSLSFLIVGSDYTRELEVAGELARRAGALLRSFHASGLPVERKAGNEPVTEADRQANALVVAGLRAAFPDDGLLSEEAPDDGSRLVRDRVWMVDPMDGTKDFIRGENGFAVMIGLLVGDSPALGVVYQPMGDRMYTAATGRGAWTSVGDAAPERIHVSDVRDPSRIRMVASKSHREAVIDQVRAELGITDELNVGSVGLKLGLIARGERDLYVNPSGHSKLWDVCGPEAILVEAGGRVTDARGAPLAYRGQALGNLRGLIASNGLVHDEVVARLAPLLQP